MTRNQPKRLYLVGGAVRDWLLGYDAKDLDFMVTGYGSEEDFLRDYPGAVKAGKAFPVYRVNGDEHAFARIERKVKPGHTGFDIVADASVSVMDDLLRRDLTVNAVAIDLENGDIVWVPGAKKDFRNKVLRHVSGAFAEDPLRVYRVARFWARYPEFVIAPETLKLMNSLKPELKHLSIERVFGEMAKALQYAKPSNFFLALRQSDVLDVHFEEFAKMDKIPAGHQKYRPDEKALEPVLTAVNRVEFNDKGVLPILRFAVLMMNIGKIATPENEHPKHLNHGPLGVPIAKAFCERLKVPVPFKKAALTACQFHTRSHRLWEMRKGKAAALLSMIERQFTNIGGVEAYMAAMTADGMDPCLAHHFTVAAETILSIKLPEKFRGVGAKARDIITCERARALSAMEL